MNKETVKKNLKIVLTLTKRLEEKIELHNKASIAENDAEDDLGSARILLRESIDKAKEVYVVNTNGKVYKIKPHATHDTDVVIEEIKIIK